MVAGPWNPHSKVPIHKWLLEAECPTNSERLRTLGNVVIPQCADLAMKLIASLQ